MKRMWVDEVVKSKDRYILVDAPRQSGKTYVAEEWAVRKTMSTSFTNYRINRNVLYVCSNHEAARAAFLNIMDRHNSRVSVSQTHEMKIVFDWGGAIYFVSPPFRHFTRGRRFDAVVFDEPNYLSEDSYMEAMVATSETEDRCMLAVSTGFTKGASNAIKELSEWVDVKYVFGEHDQSRRTNKDYAVLLRK